MAASPRDRRLRRDRRYLGRNLDGRLASANDDHAFSRETFWRSVVVRVTDLGLRFSVKDGPSRRPVVAVRDNDPAIAASFAGGECDLPLSAMRLDALHAG